MISNINYATIYSKNWPSSLLYIQLSNVRGSRLEVFCRKGDLRNLAKFTGKHLRPVVLVKLQACNFIKKETLAQVFTCKFFESSKNTFFLQNTSGGYF